MCCMYVCVDACMYVCKHICTCLRLCISVAGVGTGGTLMGAGRYLRERKPSIELIAVEPAESAVLSGKIPGFHQVKCEAANPTGLFNDDIL